MALKEIEKRIAMLESKCPAPLTFEGFQESWEHADELSKSIILTEVSCPAISSMSDRERTTIGHYLEMMGIEVVVDTTMREELLAGLASDT